MTTKHWTAGMTPEQISKDGYVAEGGFWGNTIDTAIVAGSLQRIAKEHEKIVEILTTISKRLRYLEPGFAEAEAARKKTEAENDAKWMAYCDSRDKKMLEVKEFCGGALSKWVIMGGIRDLADGDAAKCETLTPIQIIEAVSSRSPNARKWLAANTAKATP